MEATRGKSAEAGGNNDAPPVLIPVPKTFSKQQQPQQPPKRRRGRPPKNRPMANQTEAVKDKLLRQYGQHLTAMRKHQMSQTETMILGTSTTGLSPSHERLLRHLLKTSAGAKQYVEAVNSQEVHIYSRVLAGLDRVFRLVGGFVNPKLATGLMGLLGNGEHLKRLYPLDAAFAMAASLLGPQGVQFYVRQLVSARDAILILSALAMQYSEGLAEGKTE